MMDTMSERRYGHEVMSCALISENPIAVIRVGRDRLSPD